MGYRLFLAILFLVHCSGVAFCQTTHEEEITLSTYYPAPYGEYDMLSANKIGVGTTNPQGALDVTSTTSTFLPPRMTTAQRDAIAGPATGSVVYNTTTNNLNLYNGTAWQSLGGGWQHYSGPDPILRVMLSAATGWLTVPLNSVVGSRRTLVFLKITLIGLTAPTTTYYVRTKGEIALVGSTAGDKCGASIAVIDGTNVDYVVTETNDSGEIEIKNTAAAPQDTQIWLVGYMA